MVKCASSTVDLTTCPKSRKLLRGERPSHARSMFLPSPRRQKSVHSESPLSAVGTLSGNLTTLASASSTSSRRTLPLDLVLRAKTESQRLRHKSYTIPSVFDIYPETAKPKVAEEQQTNHTTPSARRSHEEEVLRDRIERFFEEDNITYLGDLYNKLSVEILPSGFGY